MLITVKFGVEDYGTGILLYAKFGSDHKRGGYRSPKFHNFLKFAVFCSLLPHRMTVYTDQGEI